MTKTEVGRSMEAQTEFFKFCEYRIIQSVSENDHVNVTVGTATLLMEMYEILSILTFKGIEI